MFLGGARWGLLFAAAVGGTVLRYQYRAHPTRAPAPRKRVRLAREHGPSWVEWCAYCHKPADTWDHVTPFSRGGPDDRWNMAPSCGRCNSSKGDRTPEEWWKDIGAGQPYPAFWPRSVACQQ